MATTPRGKTEIKKNQETREKILAEKDLNFEDLVRARISIIIQSLTFPVYIVVTRERWAY